MKRIHSIIIVVVFGVLAVSIATADLFLNREVNGSPLITGKVRAATLTYRRTLIISPNGVTSVVGTATPTITPIQLIQNITSTPSATLFPTVTSEVATPSPTAVALQLTNTTSSITPSVALSPTLPSSGWTQMASIMFIAASIVLFISFLF